MKKGKQIKIKNLQINLSNKTFYTLVLIGSLILFGVVVYALTPGTAPNPGHLISEVAPPNPCGSGQFLQFDGVDWACADVSGEWSQSGFNIYYNDGNVGIGTAAPTQKLDVNGKIRMRTQTDSTDAGDIVATKGYVDTNTAVSRVTNSVWVPYNTARSATATCPVGKEVINCGVSHSSALATDDIFWYMFFDSAPGLDINWIDVRREGTTTCVAGFTFTQVGYYNTNWYVEAVCI